MIETAGAKDNVARIDGRAALSVAAHGAAVDTGGPNVVVSG